MHTDEVGKSKSLLKQDKMPTKLLPEEVKKTASRKVKTDPIEECQSSDGEIKQSIRNDDSVSGE